MAQPDRPNPFGWQVPGDPDAPPPHVPQDSPQINMYGDMAQEATADEIIYGINAARRRRVIFLDEDGRKVGENQFIDDPPPPNFLNSRQPRRRQMEDPSTRKHHKYDATHPVGERRRAARAKKDAKNRGV